MTRNIGNAAPAHARSRRRLAHPDVLPEPQAGVRQPRQSGTFRRGLSKYPGVKYKTYRCEHLPRGVVGAPCGQYHIATVRS